MSLENRRVAFAFSRTGVLMRDFGIVALLSVIATAAAPTARPPKIENYVTSKSMSQFAGCYARSQGKRSSVRVYPDCDRGAAAFSNLAQAGDRQPYLILIRDRGAQRHVSLQGVVPGSIEARGVSQCI